MREILFRAKNADGGEWLEGYYEFGYDAETETPTHYMWVVNHTEKYGEMFIVIPETVGQYTGLIDSHGKKVFEGDILEFTDANNGYTWIGKIVFGNPHCQYSWGYNIVFVKGEKPNTDILLWFDMEETGAFSKIIGNIHDNPELIGGI